jgi:hypothetical protein
MWAIMENTMNRQAIAKELVSVAKEMTASPSPWVTHRRTSQWVGKITGLIKTVKKDQQEVYNLFPTAIAQNNREDTIDNLYAVKDAASHLSTTASDLVSAIEGLLSYADVSMPDSE